jgi:dTDP-4-amino-4,6-dideoxygalactose transaminase
MKEVSELPIGLPATIEADTRHAHHLFTIMVDEEVNGVPRDEFLDRMTAQGIGVGVHYLSSAGAPFLPAYLRMASGRLSKCHEARAADSQHPDFAKAFECRCQ